MQKVNQQTQQPTRPWPTVEQALTRRQVSCYVLDLNELQSHINIDNARELLAGRIMDKYLDRAERVRPLRGKLSAIGVGLLLSGILGIRRQKQLEIGEHGKPEPASGAYHMSISDAGMRSVVAVAPVTFGVDVEVEPQKMDRMEIRTLQRVGCKIPQEMVDHPEQMSANEFCRRWTKVEAVLKAEGSGFTADPRDHQDWFDKWPCVWADLPEHVVCAATRDQLPLELIPVDAGELLARVYSLDEQSL
ncbi:MAG: hypothetical protein Q4B54_13090 [Coriobacteriales bacterium]|nr:hypothetical protein [Coriobacteriales bacterium]